MYLTNQDNPIHVKHKKEDYGVGSIVKLTENNEAYVEWEKVIDGVFGFHDLRELTKLGYVEENEPLSIDDVAEFLFEKIADKHFNNSELTELVNEMAVHFSVEEEEEEIENEEIVTETNIENQSLSN